MKKIVLLIAVVFGLVACKEEQNKLDEKYAPYEHFFFQRSFPEESLDVDVMIRSLDKARKRNDRIGAKDMDAEWIQEGPFNIGGRINTIAVHPENPSIWISGTAGGGAYRTDDEGETWTAISETLTHLPVGDITFDPNNPETIYIGTGDLNISGNVYIGNGLYRSIDGGETWDNIGLEETRIISKVIVNPNNSDQIFVSTMGVPFEEGPDRGLYRSNDGGDTWEQILFINEGAGIIDLVMNPEDPSVLYAAGWNRIRTNLQSIASGDDAKIYKTNDSGESWEILTEGLPSGPMSRIGLHLWEGDPNVLFAVYVNPSFQLDGIYKSQNAGASFESIPVAGIPENALGGFGWYFGKLGVNPTDQNELSVLGVDLYTTTDGGNSWFMSAPPWFEYIVHADKHDMVYLSDDDILLATDGGLYRTVNGGASWEDVDRIPNTQFYRVATSVHDATLIYGGAQDNGTNVNNSFFEPDDWTRIFGGDGFQPIVDPVNENWTYCTVQNGAFYFLDSEFFDVFLLDQGYPSEERVNWDAPIRMDHWDNSILYMARERVYMMDNAPFGFWEPISPVLVENSVEFFSRRNVSTIDQSKVNGDILYAGTSDGKAWVTENGGDDWVDISNGLPGYYVTDIKASPFSESTVIVTVSGYRMNDETPHIYLSSDYGNSWIPVSGDLEEMPVNHVEYYDETTWFIASDNGVYITDNNGINWHRVGSNLPFVVVTDLVIQEEEDKLIAGTYGVSSFSIDITEVLGDVTSIDEADKPLGLSLYPNPASTFVIANAPQGSLYEIFDLNGRLVDQGVMRSNRIDISFPKGIYITKIKSEGKIYTGKLMVSDS